MFRRFIFNGFYHMFFFFFFFSSRRRHTRYWRDWSSDVCSSDLPRRQHPPGEFVELVEQQRTMLRRAREPIDDRIDAVVLRPLGKRPLDHVAGLKIPRIQAVYRIPI